MNLSKCIPAALSLAALFAIAASASQVVVDGVHITDSVRAGSAVKAMEGQAIWSFDVPPELAPLFIDGADRKPASHEKLFSDPEYASKGFPYKVGCGHGLYTSASEPNPAFSFNDRDTWWSGQEVERCSSQQNVKVMCFTSDCKNGAAFISARIYQIRPTGRQIKLVNPLSGMLVTVYAKERQHDDYLDVKTFGYN